MEDGVSAAVERTQAWDEGDGLRLVRSPRRHIALPSGETAGAQRMGIVHQERDVRLSSGRRMRAE